MSQDREILGNVASIETMGLVDGPGIRFVVFLQGCPLRCAYCHNPEMWDTMCQKNVYTPQKLFDRIKKYRTYFKDGGGVTVSGGEPLLQAEFVKELFTLCKANGINTCLDTSGYGNADDALLDVCDLIILDVKEINDKKYQLLTGQKIEKFAFFLKKCQEKDKKLWIRQVIVPNYNDTVESVEKLKEFLKNIKNVEKVELLPYHNMAIKKYNQLGIDYKLKNLPSMDKNRCRELEKILNDETTQ